MAFCSCNIAQPLSCLNLNNKHIFQWFAFWLDQVWSTLPALELLPLNCSRRRQKGSRTFMFFLGVIPVVALDTSGGVWAIMQQGSKLHWSSRGNRSLISNGASHMIILFIYFAKCGTCEINRHHHQASKLDSICVPSAIGIIWKRIIFCKHWVSVEILFNFCEREGQL